MIDGVFNFFLKKNVMNGGQELLVLLKKFDTIKYCQFHLFVTKRAKINIP